MRANSPKHRYLNTQALTPVSHEPNVMLLITDYQTSIIDT